MFLLKYLNIYCTTGVFERDEAGYLRRGTKTQLAAQEGRLRFTDQVHVGRCRGGRTGRFLRQPFGYGECAIIAFEKPIVDGLYFIVVFINIVFKQYDRFRTYKPVE